MAGVYILKQLICDWLILHTCIYQRYLFIGTSVWDKPRIRDKNLLIVSNFLVDGKHCSLNLNSHASIYIKITHHDVMLSVKSEFQQLPYYSTCIQCTSYWPENLWKNLVLVYNVQEKPGKSAAGLAHHFFHNTLLHRFHPPNNQGNLQSL